MSIFNLFCVSCASDVPDNDISKRRMHIVRWPKPPGELININIKFGDEATGCEKSIVERNTWFQIQFSNMRIIKYCYR